MFADQKGANKTQLKTFVKKLKKLKHKNSDDFLIISRIESFILGKNLSDAMKRAEVQQIKEQMLFWYTVKPKQIISFAKKF